MDQWEENDFINPEDEFIVEELVPGNAEDGEEAILEDNLLEIAKELEDIRDNNNQNIREIRILEESPDDDDLIVKYNMILVLKRGILRNYRTLAELIKDEENSHFVIIKQRIIDYLKNVNKKIANIIYDRSLFRVAGYDEIVRFDYTGGLNEEPPKILGGFIDFHSTLGHFINNTLVNDFIRLENTFGVGIDINAIRSNIERILEKGGFTGNLISKYDTIKSRLVEISNIETNNAPYVTDTNLIIGEIGYLNSNKIFAMGVIKDISSIAERAGESLFHLTDKQRILRDLDEAESDSDIE